MIKDMDRCISTSGSFAVDNIDRTRQDLAIGEVAQGMVEEKLWDIQEHREPTTFDEDIRILQDQIKENSDSTLREKLTRKIQAAQKLRKMLIGNKDPYSYDTISRLLMYHERYNQSTRDRLAQVALSQCELDQYFGGTA